MRSFYLNEEILYGIADRLYHRTDNDEDGLDPLALLHFALTCKLFFEPAMKRRWREVSSISRLLRLLPMKGRALTWSRDANRYRNIEVSVVE